MTGPTPHDDPQGIQDLTRVLRETQARLRSLLDFHPDGVFSLDLDGRFASVNQAAQLQSGFTEEELLDASFVDLLEPEDMDRVVAEFLAVLDRQPRHFEVGFRRKDGTVGELEIIGLPIVVDDDMTGIYAITEDITERRRVQQVLADARVAAEEANNAKSLFLATMSHEIRTPLTSVLAAVELLGETALGEEQRRLVDVVERSGDRLLRLVDDILDFSRIEAGRADVSAVPFDLTELVDEMALLMGPRVRGQGLTFEYAFDERLPERLVGDPERITQVLSNLIGNASKFTHQGTVRLCVEQAGQDDDTVVVRFSVSDTGIGLSEEQQQRIFDSFSQADSSITREYGGTGLGLAISRELVTLMGGTIEVSSHTGMGSTFCAVLPLALVEPGAR